MSHRKVSRSLIDASALISPGTGSHTHFRQPENELKQKLDALDTSFKISNKKIKSETRELRQILFDLQRDLRVSKSESHYVPSSFEEGHAKRQTPMTLASGLRSISPANDENFKSSSTPETIADLNSKTSKVITPKRLRKTSGASPRCPKILVQEEDVCKSDFSEGELTSGGEETFLGTEEVIVRFEQSVNCDSNIDGNLNSINQQGKLQTDSQEIKKKISRASETIEAATMYDSIAIGRAPEFKESSYIFENDKRNSSARKTCYSGLFSYSSADTKTLDPIKATPTGSSFGLTYSKHFSEDRIRSLSDSDASYCDPFRGRVMAHSLNERLQDQYRTDLHLQEIQQRPRRATVSGPPPMLPRRLIDTGDITVGPFQPESRRKKSSGRGLTDVLPVRRRTNEGDSSDDVFEGGEIDVSRRRYNSTSGRSKEPKKRSWSVYKGTSSCLPPLKEETRMANRRKAATKEWENLDKCRYLRKGDQELSVEDIFRKD